MEIFDKLEAYQVEPVQKIIHNAAQAQRGGTVFFGDSLIQSFPLTTYFPQDKIYNCGCNGATTSLLLHLQPYAIQAYAPGKVVMLIGTNDLSDTWQFDKLDIAYNVYKLMEIMRLHNPAVDVCVVSPLPIDETRKKTMCRNNVQLRLLGDEIERVVSEFSGCVYVNAYSSFLQEGTLNVEYTDDGLHLNAKGYDVLALCLSDFVNG